LIVDGGPVDGHAFRDARHMVFKCRFDCASVGGCEGILDRQDALGLALLAGPTSPLRNLLRTIDEQTFLAKPEAPKPEGGLIASATDRVTRIVSPLLDDAPAGLPRPDVARERITTHFAELHTLVAGEAGAAPIDGVLAQLGQLQAQVKAVGPAVGKASPVDPAAQAAINDLTRELRSTADGLPSPLKAIVKDVAGGVEAVVLRGVRGDLANQYAQQVGVECRELVGDRYPLNAAGTTEATPGDFGRVFGYGGVFDRFFASTLEPLVDTSRRPWVWRPTIANAAVGPTWMLRQFEAARHIRDNFFRPGSQELELSFRVSPVELDPRLTKFLLQIDGQSFEYQFGPDRTLRMTWPRDVGEAAVTFFDRSPVPPSAAYRGNWALFRLLDAMQVQAESETRHVVTFSRNGYVARVRFEADSNRNPFHRRELLSQFRCAS
jgi:type VI secretion system protein ImpL